MRLFRAYLLWPLFFASHLLTVSLLTWHLLAQVNFLYPLGYRLLAIEAHIQRYGPENRFKPDFATTTPAEHRQLFADIVKAVHRQGKGLAEITYRLPEGGYSSLMRPPEIVHLQDVANLVDGFYRLGVWGGIIWLALLIYAYQSRTRLPSLKKILSGFAVALVILSLSLGLLGPTDVFYWLHIQIFPPEHEWFFYYQDSLMTTLMKAPDLFGFISLLLLILLAFLWILSLWATARILNKEQPASIQRRKKTEGEKISRKQSNNKRG